MKKRKTDTQLAREAMARLGGGRAARKPPRNTVGREIAAILGQSPALTRPSSQSGALEYRAIGGDGDRWPAWIRAYARSCGVYVIRDKSSGRAIYVGSSKSRLYNTITRHFQQWKRNKKWWKGAYGAGHDPGLVYSRARVEVAVRVVACGSELEEESRLIARLQPRDNLVEHPDGELEEAPF